eukprot:15481716-Alexandrium_andersonii.AAC.1
MSIPPFRSASTSPALMARPRARGPSSSCGAAVARSMSGWVRCLCSVLSPNSSRRTGRLRPRPSSLRWSG